MSLFKPEIIPAEKPTDQHPWASRIKYGHAKNVKHAHNSIHNPVYPKNKENISPNVLRTKFTIIGDRISKEFIYCVHLVKGLHKYRKRKFHTPVIRGVTTVEWPSVWNDLKIKFGSKAFCLLSPVAVIVNDKLIGGVKELQDLVDTKYSYHLHLDYYKEGIAEFAKFIKGSGRPCTYMSIAIDGENIGTFIFMLYSDIVPFTCDNFLRLCKETKGGYSGTLVHRIVKDGWIQCGGFGLKDNTDLNCENFMVPHDKRGVLCMANDGRDVDCSTQFFVLLQPAPWMASKYVAFGQLIEGKQTLEKIEAVPTWYESPISQVTIFKAGIFNMECHDIVVNKSTNKYIDGHIEDLNALADLLYEDLLDKVFMAVELREIERLKEQDGEGADRRVEEDSDRFKKGDSEFKTQFTTTSASATQTSQFDVETYDPEELDMTDYEHQSIGTPSLVVKPAKPYYMPLTDIPYPGEKDSTFDLKRLLQGEYCLESDLMIPQKEKEGSRETLHQANWSYTSYQFDIDDTSFESESEEMDSDYDKEVQKYLMMHSDRVSFAGGVIRKIGKGVGKINLFSEARKSQMITDDVLRRIRLASISRDRDRKVSIVAQDKESHRIKRRQTGFVRPEDLERIRTFQKYSYRGSDDDNYDEDKKGDDEDTDEDKREFDRYRHVSMSVPDGNKEQHQIKRRQTGFVRPEDLEKIRIYQKDTEESSSDSDDKKVHISPATAEPHGPVKRRPTSFIPPDSKFVNEDEEDDSSDSKQVHISPATAEPHGAVIRRPTAFVRSPAIEEVDEDDDDEKQVHISPTTQETHGPTARRPTAFVRPKAIEASDEEYDEDEEDKQVQISPTTAETRGAVKRRATAYVRPQPIEDSDEDDIDADGYGGDDEDYTRGPLPTSIVPQFEVEEEEREVRQSVLLRLFDELKLDEEPPTLKNYKPAKESNRNNVLLSSNFRITSEESVKEKYVRQSDTFKKVLDEDVLNLQHGKKVSRKISTDYVKTIDRMQQRLENSLRTLEYANKRPALSVAEYQLKNKQYQEKLKMETYMPPAKNFDNEPSEASLRLPTSPTYSTFDFTKQQRSQHRRHKHHLRQMK